MAKPTIAIGILAITLILLLLLLLRLSFSLLRRLTRRQPHPHEPPPLSPAKLSPFYAHGVLRAPKSFLLSSPKLDAMLQSPCANGTESFVCISNPVFDSSSGGSKTAVKEDDGDGSPELRVMKNLALKAMPPPASATETNKSSFFSQEFSSPSW